MLVGDSVCDKQTRQLNTGKVILPTPINFQRFTDILSKCNPYAAFHLAHTETLNNFKKPAHQTLEQLGMPSPDVMFRDGVDLSANGPKHAFKRYLEKLTLK